MKKSKLAAMLTMPHRILWVNELTYILPMGLSSLNSAYGLANNRKNTHSLTFDNSSGFHNSTE